MRQDCSESDMSYLTKQIYFTGVKFAEKLSGNQQVYGYSVDPPPKSSSGISWNRVNQSEFDQMTINANLKKEETRGAIFMVNMKKFGYWKNVSDEFDSLSVRKVLLLDRIQDTHNFGAICRTAQWAGIDMLCISHKGNAPIGEGSLKASSGYLLNLTIVAGKLTDIVIDLKAKGFEVIGTTLKEGVYLHKCERQSRDSRLIFLMGNERYGISRELDNLCDRRLTIPMKNNVDSLNVSVATGIILYQLLVNGDK